MFFFFRFEIYIEKNLKFDLYDEANGRWIMRIGVKKCFFFLL